MCVEIAPEDEEVTTALMRAGIEQVARLHDRRPSMCKVAHDVEFADHVFGIDAGGAARHARDQR